MTCHSCSISRILFALFATAVLLTGCQNGAPEDATPAMAYDSYGAAITVDDAVPVQLVSTESDRFVGQTVKVEGIVAEVCQNAGCWLTLEVGVDQDPVRVEVPRDTSGAYLYTFPMDISGRRAVIVGTLLAGEDAVHEHGEGEHAEGEDAEVEYAEGEDAEVEHAEDEAHSEAEAAAMKVALAIVADGALVERIGA